MTHNESADFGSNTDDLASAGDNRLQTRKSLENYLGLDAIEDVDPGEALSWADTILQHQTPYYQWAAGWCIAEVALAPNADFTPGKRQALLGDAQMLWKKSRKLDPNISPDAKMRVLWSQAQMPSFMAIAAGLGQQDEWPRVNQELQERKFKGCFSRALDYWGPESPIRGFMFEALTSYFVFRAGRLRNEQPPVFATPASVREDNHKDPDKRVDVNVYETGRLLKFGLQVRSGHFNSSNEANVRKRVVFSDASKVIRLPNHQLGRLLRAIINDIPKYQADLDVLAVDVFDRLQRRFDVVLPAGRLATQQ